MLFAAYRYLSKKCTMPIRSWAVVLSHFLFILTTDLRTQKCFNSRYEFMFNQIQKNPSKYQRSTFQFINHAFIRKENIYFTFYEHSYGTLFCNKVLEFDLSQGKVKQIYNLIL